MNRGLAIFGLLFMLFFAIPFPMILYYSIDSGYDINEMQDKSPWLALIVVVVSVLLWLWVLLGYFYKWVLFNFIAKRNIEHLKAKGVPRNAKILAATKLPKQGDKYDTYELRLAFKNLVGVEIVQKTGVNDSKPYERRYEVGKSVDLLLDEEMKRVPYFIFASTQATINKSRIAFITLGWLVLVALVIGYYIYAYQTESYGMGWRFIGFGHPLFVCPVVLLFFRYLMKLIFGMLGGGATDAPLIKFKGIRTTAKLINASQTGLYVNEQPMVRFELEFTDEHHQSHRSNLKRIVNLFDLDITKQERIDIFYLRDNPKRIAFASDLDEIS